MPLLGGDLLGAVLVDRVVVGAAQGAVVAEVDLVLAEVALPLESSTSIPAPAISLRMRRINGSTREVPWPE